MPDDGTYRQLAAAILTAHQRRSDSNCLCGRLRPGDSWSEHVADVLHAAGALQVPPIDRVPTDTWLTCRQCNRLYDPSDVRGTHPYRHPVQGIGPGGIGDTP